MGKLKGFLKTSFGPQIPVRQRFFNLIFFMGILVGIFGFITCVMIKSSQQEIMLTAVITLAFPLFSYIGIRVKSKQQVLVVVALILVNFLLFPALYLAGGSIYSGIPSFFCFGMALTLFLIKGKISLIITTLESFWYVFIFYASWKWPQLCADIPAFEISAQSQIDYNFSAVIFDSLFICLALALMAKIMFNLYQREAKIVKDNIQQVEKQSIIDPLTAIYNRRFMYSYLSEQMEITRSQGKPLSVVLFDIDFFKKLNDTYGHLLGDEVLKALSSIIKNSCKKNEIVARYGGEEFLLILPNFTKEEAVNRAEEIRECIEKSILSPSLPEDKPVTISGGVATLTDNMDEETLVNLADENLYKAKKNGRNCIIFEEVES